MPPDLAPATGYYDGTRIVLTSPVHFPIGLEVTVTPIEPLLPPCEPSSRESEEPLVGIIPDTGQTPKEIS